MTSSRRSSAGAPPPPDAPGAAPPATAPALPLADPLDLDLDGLLEGPADEATGASAGRPRGLARWQEQRARQMLAEHLDGRVSLDEVARACGLSRSHFLRAFQQSTGQSPRRWLVAQRVSEAQRLLRGTALPLAEVARAAGFSSQSHFSTVFARQTGMTPRLWRSSPPPPSPPPPAQAATEGSHGQRIADNFHRAAPSVLVPRSDDGTFVVTRLVVPDPVPERTEPLPEEDAFIVGLQLRDLYRIEMWCGPRQLPTSPMLLGTVSMADLTERPSSRFGPLDTLHFYMQRPLLDSIAEEQGAGRLERLCHPAGVSLPDPRLWRLTQALLPELAAPGTLPELLISQLALAVQSHVVRTYGVLRRPPREQRGALAPWQLARARELLDAHLDGSLSVARLAGECGLSRSHFSRAFRRSAGVSPHRWLVQRRVERARSLLTDPRPTLAEIAAACGFASPSHFSRVFAAVTGLTPGAWRRLHGRAPR